MKIAKNGIKKSYAGVIQKQTIALVYASKTFQGAISAVEYEEDLKQRVLGNSYKSPTGDLFVVQFTVPTADVKKHPNNDYTLDRDILPSELDQILTKDKKTYYNFSLDK